VQKTEMTCLLLGNYFYRVEFLKGAKLDAVYYLTSPLHIYVVRLRRMPEMQTIVTDVHSVCLSVCHMAQLGVWHICRRLCRTTLTSCYTIKTIIEFTSIAVILGSIVKSYFTDPAKLLYLNMCIIN